MIVNKEFMPEVLSHMKEEDWDQAYSGLQIHW